MSLPPYEELPSIAGTPTAWSVWKDPRLGALELLTPERVRGAVALVSKGAVFALDAALDELDPPLFTREPLVHRAEMYPGGTGTDDHITQWNTQSSSQWDGFLHQRDPERGCFGGLDVSEHGVHHWAARGIVTRAVLADVFRYREAAGRPLAFHDHDPVSPVELLETLEGQEVRVEPGDVLLVHTGWLDRYRELDAGGRKAVAADFRFPGLANDEEMARTLWDLHIAAVASDSPALEAWPPTDREGGRYLHRLLLIQLGVPIGELWDLGRLAADCAEDGRYEFLLTSAPLRLKGGAASPANALAIK